MKKNKFLKILILVLTILILLPQNVFAKETVNLYLFYGNGCPHCKALEESLEKIKIDYPNLKIYRYETWYNQDNAKKLKEVANLIDEKLKGVPFTVIGGEVIQGYDTNTDEKLIETIKYYSLKKNKCNDTVGNYLGITKENKNLKKCVASSQKDPNFKINIPFIGEVNTKDISLPLVSIILGSIDGFNPCAMWILLFLITMLINTKNKKRMWILGLGFMLTSAITYLLFMISWLSLTVFLDGIIYLRIFISLIAIIGGIINLISYFKSKNSGCHVVKKEKRSKIITKIKKFTSEKSLLLALLGIIILAISVNFIELLCSAGFPVMFTSILALNDLSTMQYIIYFFLYILFFLIDDIIVFALAMKTLTVTGISTKYTKYSHLIGGIIMIIIGILLTVKPEWLMFNF